MLIYHYHCTYLERIKIKYFLEYTVLVCKVIGHFECVLKCVLMNMMY